MELLISIDNIRDHSSGGGNAANESYHFGIAWILVLDPISGIVIGILGQGGDQPGESIDSFVDASPVSIQVRDVLLQLRDVRDILSVFQEFRMLQELLVDVVDVCGEEAEMLGHVGHGGDAIRTS